MGLFTAARPPGPREHRSLTFIAPPVGAYTQALEDYASGDVEGAMRQHTVWKCVRLVSDILACMTPVVYKGPGVGFGQANRIASPQILTQPAADADIFDQTYMTAVSLLLRGNVYGEILARDKFGKPLQIELQHPDRVKVVQQRDGSIIYKYGNREMDPDLVWHKMAYRMPGVRTGLSPIKYAQKMVQLSVTAQSFGSQYFEDGGHPSGILTNDTKKMVEMEEAQTIKQRFLAAVHGTREPVVMGGGWKYEQIQIRPDESQFLETQKYTGSAICGFFGVPPEVVGEATEGSAITYANVESRGIDFMKFGLGGWVKRLENWYTALLPRGQYVKLDASQLLRSDTLTRFQALHMLVGARIITQDEARAMEDWPALTPEQRAEIDALVLPTPPPIGSPKIGS
jgi:HK97 family phage portal protein